MGRRGGSVSASRSTIGGKSLASMADAIAEADNGTDLMTTEVTSSVAFPSNQTYPVPTSLYSPPLPPPPSLSPPQPVPSQPCFSPPPAPAPAPVRALLSMQFPLPRANPRPLTCVHLFVANTACSALGNPACRRRQERGKTPGRDAQRVLLQPAARRHHCNSCMWFRGDLFR